MHTSKELPDFCMCDTDSPPDSLRIFDNLKLHRISGCRRFHNPCHITKATNNATLIDTGDLPNTLGEFTTITKEDAGKLAYTYPKFLDKVHMDIIYGDCTSLGEFRYSLLLVDITT